MIQCNTNKKTFKKIYIEITNVCNLNCPFCSKTTKENRFMKLDEFERIINEVKEYTKYIYLHVQGEPLLHPELENILKICEENEIFVNITTNATLLNENTDLLISSNSVRQINISLQALSSLDKHKYLEKIVMFINKNTDKYISLRLWGNYEIEEMTEIKDFFKAKTKNNKFDASSNKLTDHVFFSLEKEFTWPSLTHKVNSNKGRCRGTIDHIGILCDGTVIPCCLDKDGIINLGNIYSSSLEEILNKERFCTMRNNIQKGILSEELCTKCTFNNRFR